MVCVVQAINTYRKWTQYHLYNVMKSNMTALLCASCTNPDTAVGTAVPNAHLPFRLDNEKFVELQDLCDQEYTSSTGSFKKIMLFKQEMMKTTPYCKCLSGVDARIRTH